MFDSLTDRFLDEDHKAFRAVCRRFAAEHIAPFAYEWEEAGLFDRALYRKAAEAGVLAPTQPVHLGGGGGDALHGVIAGEELQRGGCTGAVVGLGSLQIALPPLLNLGTPEQQQRLAVPVLSGEKIAALAITEPDTGSDVAGIRTRATRDGDHWRISGTKTFITSGVRADWVMVLARTSDDPHGGLTFFVVERGMAGFAVSRALEKTGWWASDTAELSFDQVLVPDQNRIGPEGSGFMALMKNFEGERLMLAVNGVAIARLAFEESLRYVKERKAFGKPIGAFQVTRHKLADMATKIAAARALVFQCALAVRDGQPVPVEIAMAKNESAEVAQYVTYEAVQIFGGMGYMRETLVERLARDARLLPIGGGTQEIMKEIICRLGGLGP